MPRLELLSVAAARRRAQEARHRRYWQKGIVRDAASGAQRETLDSVDFPNFSAGVARAVVEPVGAALVF
jgi:hypothetical protein